MYQNYPLALNILFEKSSTFAGAPFFLFFLLSPPPPPFFWGGGGAFDIMEQNPLVPTGSTFSHYTNVQHGFSLLSENIISLYICQSKCSVMVQLITCTCTVCKPCPIQYNWNLRFLSRFSLYSVKFRVQAHSLSVNKLTAKHDEWDFHCILLSSYKPNKKIKSPPNQNSVTS